MPTILTNVYPKRSKEKSILKIVGKNPSSKELIELELEMFRSNVNSISNFQASLVFYEIFPFLDLDTFKEINSEQIWNFMQDSVVLDIEMISPLGIYDPKRIRESKIILIGMYYPKNDEVYQFYGRDEDKVIEEAGKLLEEINPIFLITENGGAFDLPQIEQRIKKKGLNGGAFKNIITLHNVAPYGKTKFRTIRGMSHIDLMYPSQFLPVSERGLKAIAYQLGLEIKKLEAREMKNLVKSGRWKELISYNEKDLELTYELLKEFKELILYSGKRGIGSLETVCSSKDTPKNFVIRELTDWGTKRGLKTDKLLKIIEDSLKKHSLTFQMERESERGKGKFFRGEGYLIDRTFLTAKNSLEKLKELGSVLYYILKPITEKCDRYLESYRKGMNTKAFINYLLFSSIIERFVKPILYSKRGGRISKTLREIWKSYEEIKSVYKNSRWIITKSEFSESLRAKRVLVKKGSFLSEVNGILMGNLRIRGPYSKFEENLLRILILSRTIFDVETSARVVVEKLKEIDNLSKWSLVIYVRKSKELKEYTKPSLSSRMIESAEKYLRRKIKIGEEVGVVRVKDENNPFKPVELTKKEEIDKEWYKKRIEKELKKYRIPLKSLIQFYY